MVTMVCMLVLVNLMCVFIPIVMTVYKFLVKKCTKGNDRVNQYNFEDDARNTGDLQYTDKFSLNK